MNLRIEKATTINVAADKLWAILIDDFENVSEWASAVHASRSSANDKAVPDGAPVAGRACTLPGFGDTEEVFTHLDVENRSFAYSVQASGLPGFVTNMQNHFELRALGPDRTELRNTVTADLHGLPGAVMKPMMTLKLKSTLKVVLEDLRYYAERGRISPRKLKTQAQRAKRAATV